MCDGLDLFGWARFTALSPKPVLPSSAVHSQSNYLPAPCPADDLRGNRHYGWLTMVTEIITSPSSIWSMTSKPSTTLPKQA